MRFYGQWHSLSDPELEHSLITRIDFNLFCCFDELSIPDYSTLCRYRNWLAQDNTLSELLELINRQLTEKPTANIRCRKRKPNATDICRRPVMWSNKASVRCTVNSATPGQPYFGLCKVSVQSHLKAMCLNLLKAANRLSVPAAA